MTGGAHATLFFFFRGIALSGSRSTGTLAEERKNWLTSSSPCSDDPELLFVRTPVTGDGGGARNSSTRSSLGFSR
jgi:hypothetical protein